MRVDNSGKAGRNVGSPSLASPAFLLPCHRVPCLDAGAATRSTNHESRITPLPRSLFTNHHAPTTRFLIDIWRPEIDVTPCRCNRTCSSNRHSKGPFPFCTIAVKLAKVLCSQPGLVCYSRRRTRVPPLGLRALAPARPTWCESLPLPGHRELCVSSGSPYPLDASKLNGDFRARSYAN